MDGAGRSSLEETKEEEEEEGLELEPVLTIHDKYSIYLDTDWSKGIGGGLWSTGLALAYYFSTDHCWRNISSLLLPERHSSSIINNNNTRSFQKSNLNDDDDKDDEDASNSNQRTLRVLELGSGNGFLSVCLIVAIKSHLENERRQKQQKQQQQMDSSPRLHVVVTDTAEHLLLMKKTIDLNMKHCDLSLSLSLDVHASDDDDVDTADVSASGTRTGKHNGKNGGDGGADKTDTGTSSVTKPQDDGDDKKIVVHPTVTVEEYLWGDSTDQLFVSTNDNNDNTKYKEHEEEGFDLIFGSDLAYRDDLHDPLIDTFQKLTPTSKTNRSTTTMILFGVTMIDTKPIFFHKLDDAGFHYEKLADHLVEPQFRGQQFGLFLIWKKKNNKQQ